MVGAICRPKSQRLMIGYIKGYPKFLMGVPISLFDLIKDLIVDRATGAMPGMFDMPFNSLIRRSVFRLFYFSSAIGC